MRHVLNRIARHGVQMYQKAKHYGSMADRGIRTAAYIYGEAIQPALRDAGFNTSRGDGMLKNSYDHYNLYANAIQSGVNVVDGVAANLRGGSFSYR
jgi:hypothetical protein